MKFSFFNSEIDGIMVVDKEKNWTSHDVCAFVRSRFKIKKVGHAGTLDPLATGVLVLLLGRATKRSQEFSSYDKDYYGTIRLGVKTDSYDAAGKVVAEKSWEGVTTEAIEQAFQKFTGVLEQIPPMVSALKHQGVRLYEIARKGKTVDRAKRTVTIREFRIENIDLPCIRFFASVSKGTYLRTLVNDLGEHLGTYGILEDLRRVRSGPFTLEKAVTVEQLRQMDCSAIGNYVCKPFSEASAYAPVN
jgi:tRNA pseudouridine55 synthase